MNDYKKYVLAGAALVTAIVVVVVLTPEQPNLRVKPSPPAPPATSMQAAQLDPATSTPPPEPDIRATPDDVGPEEFYFTLASALSGEGFTEEYIAAVQNQYGGFDPQDFIAVDAASLAGQLSQYMMDRYGYARVSTNDAADMLRVAREVYAELE